MPWQDLIIAFIACALGGTLKGAVGAGAPVVAVPILSLLFDVPTAVAIFTIPNIFTNVWQGLQYRKSLTDKRFAAGFALSGALGALIGTLMLAWLSPDLLMLIVAAAVIAYIVFRMFNPHWHLTPVMANRLVVPSGFAGGILQGSGGISAPVSMTFMNATGMDRPRFIATISIFFIAMSLVQIPTLSGLGILTGHIALLSLLSLIPLLGFMPVGAKLAQRFSKQTFDRIVLALLAVIAIKLIWSAVAG